MVRNIGRQPIQVGERHEQLVVLEISSAPVRKNGAFGLKVRCDCGGEVDMLSVYFRHRKSCEACARKRTTAGVTKFNASVPGKEHHKLYQNWKAMIARCTNPNTSAYKWYGAKGVKVCAEWLTFEVFRDWALSHGYKPGLTLDRLKSHLGYSPDNCEYVTRSENSRRMAQNYKLVRRNQVMPHHAYDEPMYGDY